MPLKIRSPPKLYGLLPDPSDDGDPEDDDPDDDPEDNSDSDIIVKSEDKDDKNSEFEDRQHASFISKEKTS